MISRLFCVGRSPELVISCPFGALPSGCWWPTDTVLVIYRLRWWSTNFCWWVPIIAGDLPTFAGEFPSAGDLPTFWWSPNFFLVMSWPLVISRLFLPLLTLLVLDHPNYGWIDWNFHKMLNNVCFLGGHIGFWVKISNFFKLWKWCNWTWKWCLLMF